LCEFVRHPILELPNAIAMHSLDIGIMGDFNSDEHP
jgi:hypothetical protein